MKTEQGVCDHVSLTRKRVGDRFTGPESTESIDPVVSTFHTAHWLSWRAPFTRHGCERQSTLAPARDPFPPPPSPATQVRGCLGICILGS